MNEMKTLWILCGVLTLASIPYLYADGASITSQQCAGCHALTQPDYEALGTGERAGRSAPPLFYAGNKFRREWLESWLQQPARLRPAGYYPPTHVKKDGEGDRVDNTGLPRHPALDAGQAAQVADYLMTLRGRDELIAEDHYQPGPVSLRMGMMDFRKFKGCNACHQDAPGEGGVSGPELHDAWQRLQPAFLSSYIQNPAAWDPHSMMPVPGMNEPAVHKLVNYLKAIGEQ